ncbi:MAG: UDP-N-acetylmuramate dehydrogenase [Bacillota bacterium]|nr:UDP-N-acetylmuramate dehydrogenase [Bacillota bacterium]MDK2960262.1 UDP-N-acetylmuramate dehydrogenase [Bacillota bacterium]
MSLEIREGVALKDYTSYKIGGPARYFCEPHSIAQLKDALTFAEEHKLPIYILGCGTNVLVSDSGVDGLVIRIAANFAYLSFQDGVVQVGSGLLLDHLVTALAEEGLGGFEVLAGIPGSVGGGIFMNAGAYGVTLGDFVQESIVMDFQGFIRRLPHAEHAFSYRHSVFQEQDLIVLETLIKVEPRPREEILERIAATKEKRRRHPRLPSCGSTFRNPPGTYAGKVIEELGLKGVKIGRAQISPEHANFIVNLGGAKAADVYALIRLVQKEAAARGITMVPEVRLWGEFPPE